MIPPRYRPPDRPAPPWHRDPLAWMPVGRGDFLRYRTVTERDGVTVSDVVREAVAAYLARR